MIRIFKKMDITGVAVLLLAFFVAVGFTAAKEMQQEEWYEVNLIDEEEDHNDPSNQEIGSALTGNPQFPCVEASGTICAVQLTLGPNSPVPADMQEALDRQADDDTDVHIDGESFKL